MTTLRFAVDDGQGTATSATFTVGVTQVNDEQTISTNNGLSLQTGQTATITAALLTTSDPDNSASQLTYTVTSSPTNGTLQKSGASTTTFTQADINAGLITYEHDGGTSTTDSFSFTVDDGQGTSSSGTFSITITIDEAAPELPQVYLDTTLDATYNRAADIFVAAGGDVQAAIDAALPGQIIELEAGATFTGNFTLPNKTGDDWIYIRTSDYANLPAPGTRIDPTDASHMAHLVSTNKTSLLLSDANAHNFRFIGIEFENTYAATDVVYNIVRLQDDAHDITFDRVYIHGSIP